MKKTIILKLALIATVLFNCLLAAGSEDPVPAPITGHVSTLVINANVTVVLVNNEKATMQVVGDNKLAEMLIIEKDGDTLRISSHKKKNPKESGVIYIP